jgi:hypothetical protein
MTRQSISLQKILAKVMDARIKSGHDSFLDGFLDCFLGTQLRDLAAGFARVLPEKSRPKILKRAQGRPGARCTRGLACKFT